MRRSLERNEGYLAKLATTGCKFFCTASKALDLFLKFSNYIKYGEEKGQGFDFRNSSGSCL